MPGSPLDLLVALAARSCGVSMAVLGQQCSPAAPHLEHAVAVAGGPLPHAPQGVAAGPHRGLPAPVPALENADLPSALPLQAPPWLAVAAPPDGKPLVVGRTAQHRVLRHHPWVQGAPGIGSFAALALLDGQGARLGTLAVLDTQARRFSAQQLQTLRLLAEQAVLQLQALPAAQLPVQSALQAGRPAAPLDPCPVPAFSGGQGQVQQLQVNERRAAYGTPAGSADPGTAAGDETRAHKELLQVQRRLFALDLELPEVLALVAGVALRIGCNGGDGGAGHGTSAGGATVELLEGGHLVVKASAGPMGWPPGTVVATGDSALWPSVAQGSRVLRGGAQAAGLSQDRGDGKGNVQGNGPAQARGPGGEPLHSVLAMPLRVRNAVIGMLKVVSVQARAFSEDRVAHLEVLAETLGSLVQLRHLTDQLDASQKQYKLLFDAHPQPMWLHAVEGGQRILAANHAMVALYGYSEAALLQMDAHELLAPAASARSEDKGQAGAAPGVASTKLLPAPAPFPANARFRVDPAPQGTAPRRYGLQNGRMLEAEIFQRTLRFDGRDACQVALTDVTEQLRTGREQARLERLQQWLGLCNEALVRSSTEAQLLQQVCRLAVDTGGYLGAWVGLVHSGAGQRLEPVASAGFGQDHFDRLCALRLSWSGLHGAEGPVSVRSVASLPECSSVLAQLRTQGVQAVVSLALRQQDQTFGLLRLYAPQQPRLGAQETALLQKLANDLAFGITALRTRQEQQSLQASVLKVAAAVSASTGTAFFEQLARNMAEALGAQVACIGRLAAPLPPGAPVPEQNTEVLAESLAIVVHGQLQPSGTHSLARTPTGELLLHPQYLVTEGLEQAYPDAPIVRAVGAQAYAGMQLQGSHGQPLGMLFVLFCQPLTRPEFVLSTLQIFAARCAAELERQGADARIRRQASLLDSAQDAILVRDLQHRVLFWNKGAERAYGWSQEEALGQCITQLIYSDTAAFERATQAVLAQGAWSGEIAQQHRAGHSLDMEGRWTLVCGEDGKPESILSINTDVTARKTTERQIQRLAFYDPLTGLPNRMLLMERMGHALASARCNHLGGALLFIDLDHFKTLNDTLGHDKGDLLLQQVARRLETCCSSIDTVARLGGDEFVVLLEGLSAAHNLLVRSARDVGETILACLSAPYDLGGYQYRSTPSIGIAPFSGAPGSDGAGSSDTVGELLKQADLAMYQSKTAGRHTLRFFDPRMQQVVTERAALERDLRMALAEDQFSLHYQPQVDHQGRSIGVEALLRWNHPRRGNVPPADFIALAEETGLILMLGRWVLHTACRRLAQWRKDPQLRHLTMAVNVSSRQFRHASFVQDVVRVLAVTGAPSSLLKLELTESLLVEDMDATIATMTALRTYSIGFSLDDFGTGYSSLGYLKCMPLDQLKIDQGFVRDLLTDANDAAIVNTIIALGQSLGLQVMAEGVETVAQRDLLLRAGCKSFQGYLYGRPVPEDGIDAVLLARVPQ